jgi:hypothetical protein
VAGGTSPHNSVLLPEKFALVTSSNPQTQVATVPFSFTDDQLGKPQNVTANLGGFDYPGEVIVADEWDPRFGETLTGESMFRLILLQSDTGPAPDQIGDNRICVATQSKEPVRGDRIGESRAVYDVGQSAVDIREGVEADIQSIREVRQNYAAVADPQLDRLTSALVEHETRAHNSLAEQSHDLWKSGAIVSSDSESRHSVGSGQIFLLDSPQSWIDVAAARFLERPAIGSSDAPHITPPKIFGELQSNRLNTAKDQLRRLCGLRLDEPTVLEQLGALMETHNGELPGVELIKLLLHQHRYPPMVAVLWVTLFTLENEAEFEMLDRSGERNFVSSEYVLDLSLDEISLNRIRSLRSGRSSDWDAVLPFLKLIAPHANSTRYGGGRDSDAEEFNLQLAAVCERIRTTSPLMQSLEIAAGATDRPLTSDDDRLIKVTSSLSWSEYVVQARIMFGSVAALRGSLATAALRWSAVETAPEIERAIYYLDQVEFGRFDHTLAIDRQLLRSRFDLVSIVNSSSGWLALRDEFEQWRQNYRRAYLEDHTDKQVRNLQLKNQISLTARKVEQIVLLERVEAIRLGTIDELAGLWDETIRSFNVCENDGAGIRLVDEPVCPDCRGRLGQPPNHTDIVDMITEVEQLFVGYRDRLASVVSKLVLKSPTDDKLRSLFRLNSAGDLSDLASVLDDKVISFLNELFGDTQGSGGNTNDWTYPGS